MRILVPLDGSELAEAALGPAQELARRLGAVLVLVRPTRLPAQATAPNVGPYLAAYDADCALADAEVYLGEVANRLRTGVHQVRVRAELGSPAEVIAQVAAAEHADVIMMAPLSRRGQSSRGA